MHVRMQIHTRIMKVRPRCEDAPHGSAILIENSTKNEDAPHGNNFPQNFGDAPHGSAIL